MAAIAGLPALKTSCAVTIFTESRVLIRGFREALGGNWRDRGWMQTHGKAANSDLWQPLMALCERHEVAVYPARGRAGNPGHEQAAAPPIKAARQKPHNIDSACEEKRSKDSLPKGLTPKQLGALRAGPSRSSMARSTSGKVAAWLAKTT